MKQMACGAFVARAWTLMGLLAAPCLLAGSAMGEAANGACVAAGDGVKTVAREAFRIRDPFVLPENGTYYLYESKAWSGGRGVFVRTSKDLENWTERQPVMTLPADSACTAVWAPEVHKYNGAYWLFTTLTFPADAAKPVPSLCEKGFSGGETMHPRGVWVFRSDRPTGPFKPVKDWSVTPAEWMCLDGTLWVEDGTPWMVFCHEWIQTGNGRMMAAPLTKDLSSFAAEPIQLFKAADVPDGGQVTDGPFLFRTQDGALRMIWSNFIKGSGYCVLQCASESGSVRGPWKKHVPLYARDGGHGMLFRRADGTRMLTIHQPNKSPDERMRLFSVRETPEGLSCAPAAGK